MVAVLDGVMPVTTPVGLTDALPELLLAHVPPGGLVVSVVVNPWHTDKEPVKAAGAAFTDTVVYRKQPVGSI
jgi:hypothetical protein